MLKTLKRFKSRKQILFYTTSARNGLALGYLKKKSTLGYLYYSFLVTV